MYSTYLKNLKNLKEVKTQTIKKVKIRMKKEEVVNENPKIENENPKVEIENENVLLDEQIKDDFARLRENINNNLSDIEDEIILEVPEIVLTPRAENRVAELRRKISQIQLKK